MTRDEKKIVLVGDQHLKPTVRVYTLSGTQLSEFLWTHGRVAGLGWTERGLLLVVTDEGRVCVHNALGRLVDEFEMGSQMREGEKVIECQFWAHGVAALTTGLGIVCATIGADADAAAAEAGERLGRPAIARLADTGLTIPPTCWLVVPPEADDQELSMPSPLALLATQSGSVVATNAAARQEHDVRKGVFSRMCLSPGGKMLACFVAPFVWVVMSDFSQNLAEFDTQSQEPPEQMAWCGNDSVVLYWDQLALVVGPHGEWIKYSYDQPLHLISETDGLRIVSNECCEFLERVPEVTASIFNIGSLEPGALLYTALEYHDSKSPKADENLRTIKDRLPQAVDSCIEAAAQEFGHKPQRALLRAAALGKAFVESYAPDKFVSMCKTLRVLNAVRAFDVGLPMTHAQLSRVTLDGLVTRLINMNRHLLALRLCESMGLPSQRVLTHWACEKVRSATGDDLSIGAQILAMLRDRPGIPYARIAAAAVSAKRKELATRLIEFEPRASEQVPLLLSMGLDDLALSKALDSGDTDLAYVVVLKLLEAQGTGWFEIIRARPAALDLLITYLRSHDAVMLTKVLQTLDHHGPLALHLARLAYQANEFEVMVRILKDVQQTYAQAPRESLAVSAKITEDQLRLLLAQRELELSTGEALFGLSLAATISKLLSLGDLYSKAASKLRSDFKVSDKKFWWLRLKAISENPDPLMKFGLLERLAKEKKSPIGYEPFADVCIAAKIPEEAMKYIPLIQDPVKRVNYLVQIGRWHEAAEAAAKERNVPLLQHILTSCKVETERQFIEALIAQLTKGK